MGIEPGPYMLVYVKNPTEPFDQLFTGCDYELTLFDLCY